ncbi:MAG: RsmD family RNA methyltransferase [Bacteroidales bacterium]
MRIVSGTHKGRLIHPTSNMAVRPTTDFAKESLFNILNNRIDFEETSVLDLFAGTGSITYEFASRGAKDITAIDINPRCCEFIRTTAATYGFLNITAVRADMFAFLGFCKVQYNLIFADPPYDMKNISLLPDLIFNNKLLNDGGLFILEHSRYQNFTKHPAFFEHRNYGKVNFSFFSPVPK